MKKQYGDQAAYDAAAAGRSKKNTALWVFVLSLLIGSGIVVSMPLLGDSLRRFSAQESNVITLVPPAKGGFGVQDGEGAGSVRAENPAAGEDALALRGSDAKESGGQPDGIRSRVQVSDDVQTWDSETRVDLFRSSYGGTVSSGSGDAVIAPGTAGRYAFTVKNNSDALMDYEISLEVKDASGNAKGAPAIPLEWRLLEGGGAAAGGWQEYNGRAGVLKQAALDARHQDHYTIEWRWAFERGKDADETDTRLGNPAEEGMPGVEATIYVRAEQNFDGNGGGGSGAGGNRDGGTGGSRGTPQTGDTTHLLLYTALLAASACAAVLLAAGRRGKRKAYGRRRRRK